MADDYIEKWEKQRKKEIDKFFSGWNWERVFLTWHNRISDYPVSLEPLFKEVWVHDPKYPVGRENVLSWCPEKEINQFQLDLQRHFNRHPGTNGPTNPYNCRQGELDTLDYLWTHKDNIEKIAAILINASLFTRLRSSRNHYPVDYWPQYDCVNELDNWAFKVWDNEDEYFTWQHYHTEVLPEMRGDHNYRLDDLHAVISYLAEEHALVFLKYRPVSIVFKEKRDSFIEKILNDEYKVEQQRLEEFRESQKIRAINIKKQQEINYNWKNISGAELERLVWTKPAVILAKEFGVSDVAIAKRCKSLGIAKPKPGFWAKVNAGLIQHPNGKPV